MSENLLAVEDDPRVARLLVGILGALGYQVDVVATGEEAIERVALDPPELILLDLMLPGGMDGYELCRRLREFSDVPIIMVTARAKEADLLRGFEAGADDYLTKPFSSRELVARVRALLRRARRPEEVTTRALACGEVTIDFARHTVTLGERTLVLTRTEYALLRALALHPNRVLTHEALLTEVWGAEYRDDIDYLRAYVYHLRRKLEPNPSEPQYIVTYPGVGYMLLCPEEPTGAEEQNP